MLKQPVAILLTFYDCRNMGYFPDRYDSIVVIYNRKMFITLATDWLLTNYQPIRMMATSIAKFNDGNYDPDSRNELK